MYWIKNRDFEHCLVNELSIISPFLVRYNLDELIGELHLHSSILIVLLMIILRFPSNMEFI